MRHSGEGGYSPCVTKLPKLRPTMQCHVGPFLSSNCWFVFVRITLFFLMQAIPKLGSAVRAQECWPVGHDNRTVFLMCCAMSFSVQVSPNGSHYRDQIDADSIPMTRPAEEKRMSTG